MNHNFHTLITPLTSLVVNRKSGPGTLTIDIIALK